MDAVKAGDRKAIRKARRNVADEKRALEAAVNERRDAIRKFKFKDLPNPVEAIVVHTLHAQWWTDSERKCHDHHTRVAVLFDDGSVADREGSIMSFGDDGPGRPENMDEILEYHGSQAMWCIINRNGMTDPSKRDADFWPRDPGRACSLKKAA